MIVLDAVTVIAHLDPANVHHQAAVAVMREALPNKALIHPVTMAEVLVGPARAGAAHTVYAALLAEGIQIWTPESAQPQRVADLRAASGLKLPDCYPLDTAEQTGSKLATFDHQLAKRAAQRGVTVLGAPPSA
jgi:predicted nucleic acid-binding protein